MKTKVTAQMIRIQKTLGKRIRALRRDRKLSQPRMAPLAGIHVSHLSQLERGRANATLSTLVAVAAALQVRLGDLLQDVACLSLTADAPADIPESTQHENCGGKAN